VVQAILESGLGTLTQLKINSNLAYFSPKIFESIFLQNTKHTTMSKLMTL
jgi:hypothetical protein